MNCTKLFSPKGFNLSFLSPLSLAICINVAAQKDGALGPDCNSRLGWKGNITLACLLLGDYTTVQHQLLIVSLKWEMGRKAWSWCETQGDLLVKQFFMFARSLLRPWREWADLGCPARRNVTYPSSGAWTQIIYVNFTSVRARTVENLMPRIKIYRAQIYCWPVLGSVLIWSHYYALHAIQWTAKVVHWLLWCRLGDLVSRPLKPLS